MDSNDTTVQTDDESTAYYTLWDMLTPVGKEFTRAVRAQKAYSRGDSSKAIALLVSCLKLDRETEPIPPRTFTAADFADGALVPVPAREVPNLFLSLGINTYHEEGRTDTIDRVNLDSDPHTPVVIHGSSTISAFGLDDNVLVAIRKKD